MEFTDRLKQIFAEIGDRTPADIARRIDVPHTTATNYLKGRMPAAEVLIKIARETNVSINWLLAGVGAKYQSQPNGLFIQLDQRENVLIRQKADDHQMTPEQWAHAVLNRALNELELLPYPGPDEELVEIPLYEMVPDKIPNEKLGAAFRGWIKEIAERASR